MTTHGERIIRNSHIIPENDYENVDVLLRIKTPRGLRANVRVDMESWYDPENLHTVYINGDRTYGLVAYVMMVYAYKRTIPNIKEVGEQGGLVRK